MIHDLKCWPEYFQAVKSGIKPFELRKDDRGFAVGDVLHLREFDPDTALYTGDEIDKTVTYALPTKLFGALGEGAKYVIMGLAPRDWTPCAEGMPENEKEVLLTCVSSRKRIYECKGYYLAKHSKEIGCADDLESDYDEETDRNYCPEGFYECIENWGDYSFVYINDTVLAWQPLPKPWTGGLDGK